MIKCMFFFWNSWSLKIKLARPAALPKIWCVFLVLGLCSSDVGRADVGFREDRWAKGRRGNSWCLVVWSIGFPPQKHRRWSARNMPEKRSRHFNSHLGSIFFDFFGALDIEMSEIEAFFECLILVILNPWQAWKKSICCEVQGCSCASLHSGVATGKLFKLHVLSWCVVVEAWVFFSNLQECDGVESEILAQEVGMYTAEIADSLL